MADGDSVDNLLDFLSHASQRGLMPAATAQALAVACRNVLGTLDENEKHDVRRLDLEAVIKRFNNKRAKDFSPGSLRTYAQRTARAIELFSQWRDDPANFTVATRATSSRKARGAPEEPSAKSMAVNSLDQPSSSPASAGTYQSAFPVRPGRVVTIANIPDDLTPAEADRLAAFVRMLAAE